MNNPSWATPKTIRQRKAKNIMGAKNMSLKDKILKQMENVTPKISQLEQKAKDLQESTDYTLEYKERATKQIQEDIKGLEGELTDFISEAAEKELRTIKVNNPNTDTETSNILKMLEMTKETITDDELQELLDNNINDPLVVNTIYSIAQSNNIAIDKPVDEKENLQQGVNKLINAIQVEGIDSLGVGLSLHYLD